MKTKPYLVIQFIQRPKEGVNTSQKGWMDIAGNLQTFEKASVVDRLNNKTTQEAGIIIDLLDGSLTKCRNKSKPDEEYVAHYVGKYETMITESLREWARREVIANIE